jgi:hypothetical protein
MDGCPTSRDLNVPLSLHTFVNFVLHTVSRELIKKDDFGDVLLKDEEKAVKYASISSVLRAQFGFYCLWLSTVFTGTFCKDKHYQTVSRSIQEKA